MKTTKLLLIGMMFAGAMAHADVAANCSGHDGSAATQNRSADQKRAAADTGTVNPGSKSVGPNDAVSDS